MLEKILTERRAMTAAREREIERYGKWTGASASAWVHIAAAAVPFFALVTLLTIAYFAATHL